MNVNLHIKRLILDGLQIRPGEDTLVKTAVEAELSRLFAEGGLSTDLRSGGAITNIHAGSIDLSSKNRPAQLGEQIARAVYSGIGDNKRT